MSSRGNPHQRETQLDWADPLLIPSKWNFTTADYKGVLQWMEDNGATVEQAALNWLKEEGDSWMPWVTEEARAGT